VNEALVRIAPDPSWTTVTTSKVVYIGRLRVYNDGTSKRSVKPQDEDNILMLDDVYAEAIDLQPYYNDQPIIENKRPPPPPPDNRPAKPPGGGRPPRQPPGGGDGGGGGGGGMRLRPRHRQPIAVAVQQHAMDVDDVIAVQQHAMGVNDVIAAPAPQNAEVIPNHLPGGGQQNHAAREATTPVLIAQPHPAYGQQLAIDQAAAATRRIRFRHHLHQHRQIHPYAGHQLPPLQLPSPQQTQQLVPLSPGINYDNILTVPIVPLPRPTLFNWRQPALNRRPQAAIMQPPVDQQLAVAGGSGSQPPTNPTIISVDISGLPPIQSNSILDFSTPSQAQKAASPAWPPSTAERRATMRNRHDTIPQCRWAYEYRRQLANPDTDDEDMEGDQARPVRRRQITLDIPAYNPLSMQQRLDALRSTVSKQPAGIGGPSVSGTYICTRNTPCAPDPIAIAALTNINDY
jgi:hypothetical protein